MSNTWEKIFFFLTFIFQGSSFLNPAAYAIMHRRHHTHTDTKKDPHSPIFITNIISFNLATAKRYRELVVGLKNGTVTAKNLPRWNLIENLGESILVRALFILMYVMFYLNFATNTWQYFLLPLNIFMGPIHGFIVNWFGHKTGYRNFKDLKDNSKNSLPLDFLMMGELYQNNHHQKPNDMNFAENWFEFDFGYLITSILKKMKVIY
jgi:stearoyl-CoA desaturase (delta-9 desaturase)